MQMLEFPKPINDDFLIRNRSFYTNIIILQTMLLFSYLFMY
jgi:hypothetical protein